jgi:hypothetical protein
MLSACMREAVAEEGKSNEFVKSRVSKTFTARNLSCTIQSGIMGRAFTRMQQSVLASSLHRSIHLAPSPYFFHLVLYFVCGMRGTVLTCSKSTAGFCTRLGMLSRSHLQQVHAAPDELQHHWVA